MFISSYFIIIIIICMAFPSIREVNQEALKKYQVSISEGSVTALLIGCHIALQLDWASLTG